MTMLKQIEKEKQNLARCEKSLALEKLKKRKADTRRKIELGGLVIKSGMEQYNKAIILGSLDYVFKLIKENGNCSYPLATAWQTGMKIFFRNLLTPFLDPNVAFSQ